MNSQAKKTTLATKAMIWNSEATISAPTGPMVQGLRTNPARAPRQTRTHKAAPRTGSRSRASPNLPFSFCTRRKKSIAIKSAAIATPINFKVRINPAWASINGRGSQGIW